MLKRTLLSSVLMFVLTNAAVAGPLMPTLVPDVAGETVMTMFPSGTGAWIDWYVLDAGDYGTTPMSTIVSNVFGSEIIDPGEYLYAYQVESNLTGIEIFTVPFQSQHVIDFGWIGLGGVGTSAGRDLDSFGHDSTTAGFENLGGSPAEHEGGNTRVIPNTKTQSALNLSWIFETGPNGMIDPCEESTVLWVRATEAPTYGTGTSQAGSTPMFGDVPTAIPAPAALPAGLAMLGALAMFKRRRRSAE